MFFKLFGISFHIFAPKRENAFFRISSLDFFYVEILCWWECRIIVMWILMSLKTSLKYLSVYFFRLCRALSLRRIHNTRNYNGSTLSFTNKGMAWSCLFAEYFKRSVRFWRISILLRFVSDVSPRDKTIG